MSDKEIYQQIEEYREEADSLYEKIHEQVESSIVKHAQAKKKRKKLFVSMLSVAVVLVVTLGIVLPIVLKPQEEEIRYSNLDALSYDELDYNLKQYYEMTNQSLLYLDWYEYAEERVTARYYEVGKESDTVYLYEAYTDGNTSYSVELTVMKRNIVVESKDDPFGEFETTSIGNTQIVYVLNKSWALAKFEYQGYKYYLEIKDEITLDFLFKTIESMFNN